jgi:hypothetical protein
MFPGPIAQTLPVQEKSLVTMLGAVLAAAPAMTSVP